MDEYFHSVLPFKICWLLLCFNISYWISLTELDDLDIKKYIYSSHWKRMVIWHLPACCLVPKPWGKWLACILEVWYIEDRKRTVYIPFHSVTAVTPIRRDRKGPVINQTRNHVRCKSNYHSLHFRKRRQKSRAVFKKYALTCMALPHT